MNNIAKYPLIEEIKSGWAAKGDGWAVHAPTKEDAIKKYKEREKYYDWLATQPLPHERSQLLSAASR